MPLKRDAAPSPTFGAMRTYAASSWVVLLVVLAGCGGGGGEAATDVTGQGAELVARSCVVCHSVDGSARSGPTFLGAWGGTVTFEDGSTASFDRAYLERATVEPGARIVDGYTNAMPSFALSEAEFDALESYLRTLADG